MGLSKNKKRILLIAVLVMAVVIGGLSYFLLKSDEASGFVSVTPTQAMELIKTRENLMIIDVRGREELRQGWIEGSVLMPLPDIMSGKVVPPKDRPILLVCAVGGRSLGLGKAMINYGWTEVYNLQFGIARWKQERFPLRYR